jgi:hypothetical protein
MTSVTSLPGIIPYAGIDLMIFNSLKDYYHHTYPDKPAGNNHEPWTSKSF